MLSIPKIVTRLTMLFLLIFPQVSSAGSDLEPIKPVWEKINGQWKFNKTDNSKHTHLLHIITSTTNTPNQNLLIKDLVKLPFVIILKKNKLETIKN